MGKRRSEHRRHDRTFSIHAVVAAWLAMFPGMLVIPIASAEWATGSYPDYRIVFGWIAGWALVWFGSSLVRRWRQLQRGADLPGVPIFAFQMLAVASAYIGVAAAVGLLFLTSEVTEG